MKIKAPANRPRTQRDIDTRTRATQRRGEPSRGGRKVKKQDNTKLYIGLGVGGFFLFIFLIAAIAGGGSEPAPVENTVSSTTTKKKFNLPTDVRKKIYADYVAGENRIEDDAQSKTTADRSAGADIRKEVDRLKQSLRIEIREKWQKKYPGVNSAFIKRVITEGIKKNWSI